MKLKPPAQLKSPMVVFHNGFDDYLETVSKLEEALEMRKKLLPKHPQAKFARSKKFIAEISACKYRISVLRKKIKDISEKNIEADLLIYKLAKVYKPVYDEYVNSNHVIKSIPNLLTKLDLPNYETHNDLCC